MKIVISSGHGKYISGAVGPSPWGIHEHEAAVDVVNKTATFLRGAGVETITYEDTVSHTQDENLNRIVDFHNAHVRDLDISVHFNSTDPQPTGPVGTECWYVTQERLAANVASAIADAGHLKDRGPKYSNGLFFLNSTSAPAILVEVCFVNSHQDCDLYRANVDAICAGIAAAVSGQAIDVPPPLPIDPPVPPDTSNKPMLRQGDSGPYVVELQQELNVQNGADLVVDGDFGPATDTAVRDYQASRGLDVDGIVGDQTWAALDQEMPPLPPPPGAFTAEQQAEIENIANDSSIRNYNWADRGVAPQGYTQGMALAFATSYRKLKARHPAMLEASKARTNSDKDALNVYRSSYAALHMSNEHDGIDTLRHLFALMLGSGMRESSGEYCTGRDQSADNVASDTCEAGLFQTSYNAHSASDPEFDDSMDEYLMPQMQALCYLDAFAEEVSCSSADWENYGSGRGYEFQKLCKTCPAFAVETHALTLRNLCNHYGPITRHEVELKAAADTMFQDVQDFVDTLDEMAAVAAVDDKTPKKAKPKVKHRKRK